MSRLFLFALLLLAAVPAQAAFDPVEFFGGRTKGEGVLKIIFERPRPVAVQSEGRVEEDGTLLLTQRVQQSGEEPRTRHWRLRRVSATRFTGTLTDAAGPVVVDLIDGRARIRYKMKNRMSVELWLAKSGAKTVTNEMKVRRFGMVVARLSETIRKLD